MESPSSHGQRVAGTLTRAATAIDAWLDANRGIFLGVACLVSFLANAGYAHFRAMTADEFLKLIIIRQPNLHALWDSLLAGVQSDPPLQDAAVHYLYQFFGENLFLARLPSAAAFTLMCLCLSLVVWRYAGAVYGAAVFFMPFATALRSWGSLCRPYAPLLGFSALALLCWDRLQPDPPHPWRWRIGLVLSLALAFSMHFYSIAILFPLGLGELTKWRIRKRIDWPAILCIAVSFIPYLLWTPILVASGRAYLGHPGQTAAFRQLYEFYGDMLFTLPWVMALLLMLFAGAYQGSKGDGVVSTDDSTRAGSGFRTMMVVCGACLLLPICGTLVGQLREGLNGPKLHLISAFGLMIGLPLALTLAGARKIAGLALLAAMAGNAAMVTAQGMVRLGSREYPYPSLAELRSLIPEPHPDIVIGDSYDYGPFEEANQDDPENNSLYLYDKDKQLAVRGSDTPDVASRIVQGRSRARVLPFDSYVATHSHFYLLSSVDIKESESWQFKYLLNQMHARLFWLGNVRGWDLYRVDLP